VRKRGPLEFSGLVWPAATVAGRDRRRKRDPLKTSCLVWPAASVAGGGGGTR
jgi:hypothetical protein